MEERLQEAFNEVCELIGWLQSMREQNLLSEQDQVRVQALVEQTVARRMLAVFKSEGG